MEPHATISELTIPCQAKITITLIWDLLVRDFICWGGSRGEECLTHCDEWILFPHRAHTTTFYRMWTPSLANMGQQSFGVTTHYMS